MVRFRSESGVRAGETHMVGGAMLPIQRLGDEHLPEHGVDIEHLVGRLISADARDAVADRDVLILVRADLNKNKRKSSDRSVNAPVKCARARVAQRASHLYFFKLSLPGVKEPTQTHLPWLNST